MPEDDSEQKGDILGSWNRSDEDFFARGACHVLCAVFLQESRDPNFSALLVLPANGFRGRHVVAASSSRIFDWRGFSPREEFLTEYSRAYRSRFPGWNCTFLPVADPAGDAFCAEHNHRRRDQFLQDPMPRAREYLRRLLTAAQAS